MGSTFKPRVNSTPIPEVNPTCQCWILLCTLVNVTSPSKLDLASSPPHREGSYIGKYVASVLQEIFNGVVIDGDCIKNVGTYMMRRCMKSLNGDTLNEEVISALKCFLITHICKRRCWCNSRMDGRRGSPTMCSHYDCKQHMINQKHKHLH